LINANPDNCLFYPKYATKAKICRLSPDGRHWFSIGSLNCEWCYFGGVVVNGEVLYVPTEKGQEYHLRTEPNVLLYGGRGSAKSTTGRWDAHMRALANPGFMYVVLRRTYPELEKSHLVHVPREMKLLGGTYNQTSHKAYYPNGSIGFFSHCANDEDVLNLLSAEFHLMFFDEISTFEWEHYVKLAASVRSTNPNIIAQAKSATNPLGPSAMKINEYFVDKNVDSDEDPDYEPANWFAIKANLDDNPYLPKEEYSKRFSGLPLAVRKAWVDGEFAFENALFGFHPMGDGKEHGELGKPYHVINDIDMEKVVKSATIYRTIDSGWFPDPTVCIWFAHLGNRHIAIHEKTWYKTVAADVAADILEEDRQLGISKVAMTYCDPSMDVNTTADIKTIKEIYEANGIPMECSINKRDMFASVMHHALSEEAYENTPRLQIYVRGKSAGCPMLVRTIPQMRYDEKRTEFMADHKQDHWVVAACYYLMSHSSDPRASHPTPKKNPRWMQPKQSTRFILGSDQIRN
jgi:hypothetical protein